MLSVIAMFPHEISHEISHEIAEDDILRKQAFGGW